MTQNAISKQLQPVSQEIDDLQNALLSTNILKFHDNLKKK